MGAAAICVKREHADGEIVDLLAKNAGLKEEVEILKQQQHDVGIDPAGPGVAWLNTIVSELWPKISAFVDSTVKTSVEPTIQAALPSAIKGSFYFETVTLGKTPLEFGSVSAQPEDYVGRRGTARDINLKFDIIYRGDAKVVISAGAKVGIQDIHLEGVLTIVLKELLNAPPFFTGVSVFFANAPTITMSWNGAASVLCLLKHPIRDIVHQQICNVCVLPKRIAVVLDHTERCLFRIKAPRPAGCLQLTLVKAKNLEAKDWNLFGKATSDPYVELAVGAQSQKSTIIKKTCDPEWNEDFTFFIYDNSQILSMHVSDSDFGKGDDFLGRVAVPVSEILDKCKSGPAWFPLAPSEDKDADASSPRATAKVQGELQIAAQWLPFSLDQARAKAIEKALRTPQAMMFFGLFSIRVPPAKVGTAYTIEVSCNGVSTSLHKSSAIPAEDAAAKNQQKEMQGKIAKLRSLKASDEDIAEILDIPVLALQEEDPSASQYTEMVTVEEPFLWLIDVPKLTTVDVVVSEGKTKIGSMKFEVSRLLDPAVTTSSTVTETIEDGKVQFEFEAQVRVQE